MDSRKGDSEHPEEEVLRLRANVVRRGEKRDVSELEARRQQVSRAYNRKLDVKEKNKLRRKKRDQRISSRLKATEWYLAKLGPKHGEGSSFPAIVATHLPPNQWPQGTDVPGQEQLDYLLGRVDDVQSVDLNRLYGMFSEWKFLSEEELRHQWYQEVWLAMRQHLGGTSLAEISGARELVDRKQEEFLAGSSDVLNMTLD